jgi:hypothetical protein
MVAVAVDCFGGCCCCLSVAPLQVFLQAVISSCLQLQQAGQVLDAAAVAQQAEELLQQTALSHLQEEQLLRTK